MNPDLPPPPYGDAEKLTKGFAISGTGDYAVVEPACSSSIYHSVGRDDKTTTQNPMTIFSTKILALKALRNMIEKNCSERLYKVDQMIEAENKKPNA